MNFDAAIVLSLNAVANSSPLAGSVTVFFASWLPYLIVGGFAAYLLYTKHMLRLTALFPFFHALAAALIARGAVSVVRIFVPRDRPFLSLPIDPLFIKHASSFPSGHAAFFFAFSVIVYRYNPRLGIASFVLSTLVCIARIAAGVHYPSDIIVGAGIGLLAAALTLFVLRYLRMRTGTLESGSV